MGCVDRAGRRRADRPREAGVQPGVQPRRQADRLRQLGHHCSALGCRYRCTHGIATDRSHSPSQQCRLLAPTASGSSPAVADGTIRLWDVGTGAPIGQPTDSGQDIVWSVAFSPDGKRIASAGNDKTVRLWDAATREAVGKPLSGHIQSVVTVAFSPDGKRIVSGSGDETVRVWDADTGQAIGHPLSGHTNFVLSVAFSPDGKRIVSGGADNTVRVWDADTGQAIGQPLFGHTNFVTSVAFSPDGNRIVSAGDATLLLWPARTDANALCDKITTNMSHQQWRDWVSPDIPYAPVCPGLPVPND